MARNDVYLNINALSPADAVVTGQQDMTAATVPELVLGDTPTFNFYFTDNTNVWPSWAGNASYTLTWALSDAVAGDFAPAAITGNATPITGGWSVILPLNSYDLVGLLNTKRVGQPYPVQNLWQQLRVTDPSGNEITRAMFWTPVRYRAISDTQNTESASPTGGRFVTVNNVNTLTTPTAAQFYAANPVPTSALGTAANGELLIGNGTGFTKATLTAGSGVSITNGSGSITITATDGDITLDDGTAAAPSLKFTADTDTGLFRPSDNVVGISAGGVSRATFGATSAINGTTIPSSKTLVVTTDKLSALAATTSAELAGVISDETGSGALVFANTPTLTTPNIGAATGTSVNLSGAGTFGGNLTVSGSGKSFKLRDTAITDSNYDTLTIVASAQKTFSIGVGTLAGFPTQLTINGETNLTSLAGNLTVSGGTITGGTSGMSLASGGANQNITLTPSGTGIVSVATNLTVSGTGGVSTIRGAQSSQNAVLTLQNNGSGNDFSGLILDVSQIGPNENSRRWLISSNYQNYGNLDIQRSTTNSGAPTTLVASFTSTGNFLLGTTVDSSALLQVGTNTTTAAGGMKFGTDTSLFRSAAGALQLESSATAVLEIDGGAGNTRGVVIQAAGTEQAAITVAASGTSLLLSTGSPRTTALTLDSSQNATFAKTVTASSTGSAAAKMGTGFAGFAEFSNATGFGAAGTYALIQDNTGETYLNTASGKSLFLRVANANALTITATDATFAGTGTSSFAGNLNIKGALGAHQTATLNLAYEGSSVSQLVAYGADASTLGRVNVVLRKAGTGTDAVTGLSVRDFGIITQGGVAQTPASASATGTAGTIQWDASYIYVCTAANTWKRVAIATWP